MIFDKEQWVLAPASEPLRLYGRLSNKVTLFLSNGTERVCYVYLPPMLLPLLYPYVKDRTGGPFEFYLDFSEKVAVFGLDLLNNDYVDLWPYPVGKLPWWATHRRISGSM